MLDEHYCSLKLHVLIANNTRIEVITTVSILYTLQCILLGHGRLRNVFPTAKTDPLSVAYNKKSSTTLNEGLSALIFVPKNVTDIYKKMADMHRDHIKEQISVWTFTATFHQMV
jgi:hypothetical protein